jgi:hypothetical protein
MLFTQAWAVGKTDKRVGLPRIGGELPGSAALAAAARPATATNAVAEVKIHGFISIPP